MITKESLTTWGCVICYKEAPYLCVDVTLCEKHARDYDFGNGKTLQQMKKEHEEIKK